MASANQLGRLFIELALQDDSFKAGLAGDSAALKKWVAGVEQIAKKATAAWTSAQKAAEKVKPAQFTTRAGDAAALKKWGSDVEKVAKRAADAWRDAQKAANSVKPVSFKGMAGDTTAIRKWGSDVEKVAKQAQNAWKKTQKAAEGAKPIKVPADYFKGWSGIHGELANGLKASEAATSKWGASVTGVMSAVQNAVVIAMKAAAAAVTAFGTALVYTGAKFDQAMTTLAAMADVAPGSKEFDALEAKARELGRTTPFDATAAAEGMTELIKAGFDYEKTLTAVDSVTQLAAAQMLELDRASEIVASTLTQFQLPASDASRVVDVLAMSANKSLASVDSLAEGLKFAGPVAAGFGNSLEEVAAVLAALSNLGIPAGLAGRALRSAMSTVTQQTEDQVVALKAAGLAYEDINPSAHSLVDILNTLAKSSLTTEQALEIFGTESGASMATMAAAIRDGKASVEDLLAANVNSAGQNKKILDQQMTSIANRTKLGVAAIKDIMIEVFEGMSEPLVGLMEEVGKVIENAAGQVRAAMPALTSGFTDLFKAMGDFVREHGPKMIATAIRLAEIMLGLATSVVKVTDKLVDMWEWFTKVAPFIDAFSDIEIKTPALSDTDHVKNVETLEQKYIDLNDELRRLENTNLRIRDIAITAAQAEVGDVSGADIIAQKKAELAATKTQLGIQEQLVQTAQEKADHEYTFNKLVEDGNRKLKRDKAAEDGGKPKDTSKADSAASKARTALDALQKDAEKAAESLAKATLTPFEVVNFETATKLADLDKDYARAIEAAQKAGQSTTAIDAVYAKARADLEQDTNLQIEAAEREVATRRANAAIALQEKTLGIYETGLNERERVLEGETLLSARASIDQQRIATDLRAKLEGLTVNQVEERAELEQAAAVDSAAVEAKRVADTEKAEKAKTALIAGEQADRERLWLEAADAEIDAFVAGAAGIKGVAKKLAADLEAIDRQRDLDQRKRALEQSQAIADILATDLPDEEKEIRIRLVVLKGKAQDVQSAADVKNEKVGAIEDAGAEAGSVALGKVFGWLFKIDAITQKTATGMLKWVGIANDIAGGFAKVAKAASGIADMVSAGVDKLTSAVSTLTGVDLSAEALVQDTGGAAASYEEEKAAAEQELADAQEELDQTSGTDADRADAQQRVDEAQAALTDLGSESDFAQKGATDQIDAGITFAMSIADNIGLIVTAVVEKLPELMTAAANAIGPIIDAFADNMDEIIQALVGGMAKVSKALAAKAPEIIQSLVDNLGPLIVGLIRAATRIIVSIVQQLPQIIDSLLSQLPQIINALIASVGKIVTAVIQAIPGIVIAVVKAIPGIINALTNALPTIITALVEGLFGPGGLIDQVPAIVLAVVEAIPQIITALVLNMPKLVVALIKAIPMIAVSLIKFLVEGVPKIITEFWSSFKAGLDAALGVIGAFFTDAWAGIKKVFEDAAAAILEAITLGFAKTSLDDDGAEKSKKKNEKDDEGVVTAKETSSAEDQVAASVAAGEMTQDEADALIKLIEKAQAAAEELYSHSGLWRAFHTHQVNELQDVIDKGEQAAKDAGISFAVGTKRVPRDMNANIHEDEAVIPAAENPYLATTDPRKVVKSGLWEAVSKTVLGAAATPEAVVAALESAATDIGSTVTALGATRKTLSPEAVPALVKAMVEAKQPITEQSLLAHGVPAKYVAAVLAKMPSYDRGTRRAPRDTPANIHRDEAILPADENPYLPSTKGKKIVESGLWDAVTEAVLGFAATPPRGSSFSTHAAGWPVVDTERIVRVHPGEAIVPAHQNVNNPGVQGGGSQARSSGGGVSRTDVHAVNVMLDSQLVDGFMYRAGRQGRMPYMQSQMKKGRGTKMGLSKRKFSNWSR